MSSRNVVDLRKRPMRSAQASTSRLPLPEKKPRMPLRTRRRRTRALLVLAALLILIALAWTISYVSYLPRFQVGTVAVMGTEHVSPRLVKAYVETQLHDGTHPYLSHDNIFLYNPGRLAREIVGYFPRIKSANVSRASLLATAVQVTVTERQAFALWCDPAEHCYQMDDSGSIFAEAPAASSTLQYVFHGGLSTSTTPIGHTFAPGHLPGILSLLQSLAQSGFVSHGATLEAGEDFSIPMDQGFYIKASFGEDTVTLVKNLQLILSSEVLQGKGDQLEYIDLRFGDRVYYKLNGGSEIKAAQ